MLVEPNSISYPSGEVSKGIREPQNLEHFWLPREIIINVSYKGISSNLEAGWATVSFLGDLWGHFEIGSRVEFEKARSTASFNWQYSNGGCVFLGYHQTLVT